MPMKKYKPEQIVTLLRQIEIEIANGKTTPQACRDARIVIEKWRVLYNTLRPHSALGYKPPAPAACNPWVPNPNSQPMAVI
jgi:hypothetical protein